MQRKRFAKRVLTFMLSLAMVMTSITMPGMTVNAAQTFESTTATPAGLVASYVDGAIQISWGAGYAEGTTWEAVVTATEGDVPYESIHSIDTFAATTLNHSGEGYVPGVTYSVVLYAILDGVKSDATAPVTVTIPEQGAVPALGNPTGLVVGYSDNCITAVWGAATGATGYVVTITGVETTTPYTDVQNVTEAKAYSFACTSQDGYEKGKTYRVTLQATDGEDTTEITEDLTKTVDIPTGEEVAQVPAMPTGVTARYWDTDDANKGKIFAEWGGSAPSDPARTQMKITVDDDEETAIIKEASTIGGNAFIDNVFAAGEHTVKFVAINEAGSSEPATCTFTLTEEQAGETPEPTPTPTPSVGTYVLVSEQIEQAKVGSPVTLSYQSDAEDFAFTAETTTIKVGTTTVTNATFNDANYYGRSVTIPASYFTEAGVYEITFAVEGYEIPAVYQTVYAADTTDDWDLIWSDEFVGTELDDEIWDHQTGIGDAYTDAGWGNKEEQYYTDGDNTTVGGGKLTITARKEATEGFGTKYTSSRLRTVTEDINKETGKANPGTILVDGAGAMAYGKIEAKIKMPTGDGIWPAFWMLPHDSQYGGWAAGGEIDIVEAKGRLENQIVGTIHHGGAWPNNVNTGKWYTMPNGGSIDDYHIYTIEWDPDEMRWYLDGELYSTVNNWYSKAGEEGNYPYPAPFDEEFYILLNVAVGGTFDSEVSSEEVECDATGVDMDVDYVRWYQRPAEEYDNWDIKYPESEKAGDDTVAPETNETVATLLADKAEDGNYIKDPKFTEIDVESVARGVAAEDVKPANRGKWFPLANVNGTGGVAEYTVASDETNGNYLKVNVSNTGTQTYSTQMLNYVPIVEGYSYELTYKAWTDEVNTKSDITVAVGGDEGQGYSKYSSNYTASLTTTPKTYKHAFTMNEKTDPLARVEINLATSTGAVYLTDVCLKVIEDYDESYGEDDPKAPLANGNHLWNGEFNIGNDAMLYWHWTDGTLTDHASLAYVEKNGTDGEVKVVADAGNVTLYQKGIQLLQNDTYKVTFETDATFAMVRFKDADGKQLGSASANISDGVATADITVPSGTSYEDAIVEIVFENAGKVLTADSFKMVRTTNNNIDWDNVGLYPVYNGDFYNGMDGWECWSQDGAGLSSTVTDAGVLSINLSMPTGANFYSAGFHALKNLNVTKGFKYIVSFDYTLPAAKNYKLELGDEQRDISLQAGTHTYVSEPFSPTGLSDLQIFFGPEASAQYTLTLDNINVYIDPDSIILPTEGYDKPVSMRQKGYGTIQNGVTVEFVNDEAWEAAEKTYFINGVEVTDATKVVLDANSNTIKIDKSLVADGGAYTFAVKAEGYVKSHAIPLRVLASDNRLSNGDFSEGTSGWETYFINNCGSWEVVDGVAEVTQTWNEGGTWNIQLYQTGLSYDAGNYVVSFDAWADAEDTTLTAVLLNGSTDVAGTRNAVTLGTESKGYKMLLKNLAANSDVKFDFELGNLDTGARKIYIDNVVFRPAYDADLNTEPAKISVAAGAVTVGSDVTITYADANSTWLAANKTVFVNGNAIAADKVKNATDAGFTIDGSVFNVIGAYQINVVAEGFETTNVVKKNVIGTDGNRIFGGDMSDASKWVVYNEDIGLSEGKIENGVFKLNYTSGYYHQDWNCWVTWSSQLKQTGVSLEAGKEYTIIFDGKTTLEGGRDIIIEYGIGSAEGSATAHISANGQAAATFTPNTTSDDYYISFLLGPTDAKIQVENQTFPHTVTMDNIGLYEGVVEPRVGLEILPIAPQIYNGGAAIKPEIQVYNGAKLLVEKKDYTVSYKNNKNAGTATVTVTGKGSYKDTATETFEILPKSIWSGTISRPSWVNTTLSKTGKFTAPKVVLKDGKKTMKAGTEANPKDYIITWPEDTTAGYGKVVTITGTGNYTGTGQIVLDILPYGTTQISKPKTTVTKISYADYVAGVRPTVTVKNFVEDTADTVGDFKVVWPAVEDVTTGKNNVVTIEGVMFNGENSEILSGKLYGVKTAKFELTGTALKANKLDIALQYDTVQYTGEAFEPSVTVKDLQRVISPEDAEVKEYYTMVPGTDYTVSYTKNINNGTAQAIITGKGAYAGSVKKTFKITKVDMSVSANVVNIDVADQVYTGKAIKPAITVTVNGRTLGAKEYSVAYSANKAAGTATVVVTGKGNYTKKAPAKTFTITPKDINSSDISAADVYTIIKSDGSVKAPSVVVKDGKTKLKLDKDYTLTWPDITPGEGNETVIEPGTYEIKVKGIGNYATESERTIYYDVLAKDTKLMKDVKVKLSKTTVAWRGEEPTITVGDGKYVYGTDYEVLFGRPVIGKNKVVISAINDDCKGKLYGEKTVTITITGTKLSTSASKFEIKGVEKTYPYDNGEEIRPEIKIRDIKASRMLKLVEADVYAELDEEAQMQYDGIISYQNNKDAGTGKVIVTGVNGYSGKITKTFKIDKQTMIGAKSIEELN